MTRDEIVNATPERLNELVALAQGYEYRMLYVESYVGNVNWKQWLIDHEIELKVTPGYELLLPPAPPRVEYHYWLQLIHPDDWVSWEQAEPYDGRDGVRREHLLERVSNWSGDIGSAWTLWRELAKPGTAWFEFQNDGDGWCQAEFALSDERIVRAEGDGGKDEAATICRAYLLAKMDE
jgi:hypothetical protein